MQGALGFSTGTISTFRSNRKVSFASRKTAISAAFVEAPAVERKCSARRPRSLYEVLSLSKDASLKEIKAAYRTLAKLYHPDVSAASAAASAAMEFIEIHEAYVKLSDPEARAEYDAALGYRSPWITTIRYQGGPDNDYFSGRSWETDQCW